VEGEVDLMVPRWTGAAEIDHSVSVAVGGNVHEHLEGNIPVAFFLYMKKMNVPPFFFAAKVEGIARRTDHD